MEHSFSTHAKFSEKNYFLRTCAYKEKRNVSFSEILCTYQMNDPHRGFRIIVSVDIGY